METLFTTDDVHPRDRFAYWHEVACRNIVDHDSEPVSRLTFEAAIEAAALADLGLVVFGSSAMTVSRTPRQAARATSDELFVCRQLSGVLTLEQHGREVVLDSGDVTLLDPAVPYQGRFSEGSNLLVLKAPRRALEARVGRTRDMVARVIKPSQGEGSLTSSFLAMLPTHTGRMRPAAEGIVRENVLDLVAVSLAQQTEIMSPKISSAHSLALMSLRAVVEARLTDPNVDAAAVAAAAGISVRYANAVLAREGTSIMRLIRACTSDGERRRL